MAQNTSKPFVDRGSAPDPAAAEGAYSAPANPLAGGSGWLPLPKNPIPSLGPSGLVSPTQPTPKLVPSPMNYTTW